MARHVVSRAFRRIRAHAIREHVSDLIDIAPDEAMHFAATPS